MRRFKNIAVWLHETRDDEHILARAAELAKSNLASLSIYVMFDKTSLVPDMDSVLHPPGDVLHHVKAIKRQNIKDALASLQHDGIPIKGSMLTGKPFVRLIQEVIRRQHDLIMLPAERGSSATSLFLGGTPMHLLRKCPCAVWVFRPQRKHKFHRVMAAVNVATRNKEERKLNVKIMELATSLAQGEGGELHIVHCWTAFAESILVNMGNLSGDDLRRYRRESKQQYGDLLQTLLRRFPTDKSRTHVHLPKGDASEMIPETAAREHIDLIIMGTVARSGIPGVFIGNTAEKILNSLPCSVLAVKPDGFLSPVQPDRP